jgi:hypothetical protein
MPVCKISLADDSIEKRDIFKVEKIAKWFKNSDIIHGKRFF